MGEPSVAGGRAGRVRAGAGQPGGGGAGARGGWGLPVVVLAVAGRVVVLAAGAPVPGLPLLVDGAAAWVSWRPSPHNLYANTHSLWDLAQRRGLEGPVDLQGLTFDAEPPAGGNPVRAVRVPYAGETVVGYTYSDGLYTKLINGAAHTDAGTGLPLRFANVVLVFARQSVTPIVEDAEGARSLYFDVQRQGRALVFRDGQVYDARWLREGRNILFHFTNAYGNSVALKPGQTIVNIVPLELRVSVAR